MNRPMIIEAVAMYWPMALSASLYIILGRNQRKSRKHVLCAGMMSSAWIAAVLPWVNELCCELGYWSFQVNHGISILSLPVSLYIGWIVLWGLLPALLSILMKKWSPLIIIGIFILLDVVSMPYFTPVMLLSDSYKWLVGEILVVIFCLIPAVYLSRWVIRDTHVGKRSALVSFAFIIIIMAIIPVASPIGGFNPLVVWRIFPEYQQYFYLIALILISLPGIAGVIEFARVGNGTPIPYDPPKRLVTTGVYMYVRNPMQLSMVLVITMWAIIFSSWLMLGFAITTVIYSVGIARWSEAYDLGERNGDEWINYIAKVKLWKMSILPTFSSHQNAELYIDIQCSKCLEVKRWILKKVPRSLLVIPASEWEGNKLTRITYHDPNTGETSQGVLAFARAIQHIHLGWALLGWFISLPILNYIIQAALDASGVAPRSN